MVIDVKYRTYIALIIALIIDQLSKFLVIKYIALNHSITIIDNFFKLIYIRNTGAAWGMFDDKTIIIAILSAVFLFFLIKTVEAFTRTYPNDTVGSLVNAIGKRLCYR